MERSDLEQWKSREVARLLALVETERRYWQEIVSTLPVCLGILNHQLILVSANRAFRSRFGVRSEDLRSRRLDSILPQPELAERIREMMASPASTPPVAPLILTMESGDRLRITVQPHRDWDEDISIQALLIIEDLNVEESAEMLEAAQAAPAAEPSPVALPAVVWTAELPSMRFLTVSESAASITGIAAGDWRAPEFWSTRFSDADRDSMLLQYQKALASGGVHSFEFRLTGNPRWFRETIRIEEGIPARVHGVLSDITERRTIEEHVIQAQRMDALVSFSGRAAHDLNNPLMIVSGYGEELLESLPESDPRHNDMVQILTAAKRIEHIAAGLQAFSRKPAPAGGTGATFLDLHDLLNNAVERMRSTAGPSLTLDLEVPPQGTLIHADEVALHSLLYEVAAWMSHGETQTHLSIYAREGAVRDVSYRDQLPPGPYAIIQIENRGAEPDGSASPRRPLFESIIPGKDGSELGPALARAYRQVESWGGSLWAAPNNRCVRILLHAQHAVTPETAEARVEGAEEPKEPEPPPPPPKRVMVVDDEMGIRSLMRKVLLREGYEVLEAGSAREALDAIQDHPVDLLLTDVVMPEVSGRELAEQVVAMHPSTRVLYVSGFTAETSVETGNFPPGSQLLQKPFTLAALLRKVKDVLA